jgi:hypothetical protein
MSREEDLVEIHPDHEEREKLIAEIRKLEAGLSEEFLHRCSNRDLKEMARNAYFREFALRHDRQHGPVLGSDEDEQRSDEHRIMRRLAGKSWRDLGFTIGDRRIV